MPTSRIDSWLGTTFPLSAWDDHDQSVDAALIISDAITSIVVKRGASTTLSAQNVRIEDLIGKGKVWTESGTFYQVHALVIGYLGHPTIADTNLIVGDRFAIAGCMYEIIGIVPGNPQSLQAYARVVS